MNKARRQLKERVRKSDMVLEVLDARLPWSSQNPMLAEICRGKPCLRVLTKPDLADPVVTAAWNAELSGDNHTVLALTATEPKSRRGLIAACKRLVPARGKPGFPVRVMIAGIPNVGKSTLFNLLLGRRQALVRDQPAVTRNEQRTELVEGLALVDTPGVLWPKFDDEGAAFRLAASGAIRDAVLDSVELGRFVVELLRHQYPAALSSRYGIELSESNPDSVLADIAERRGCITRGVGPDLVKAAELLINELRAGRLGRISLERPSAD